MFYAPCHGCTIDKKTCSRRSQISQGIKGLGLTSIKFKCDDRKPKYNAGDRVLVRWCFVAEDIEDHYGNGDNLEAVDFKATIICETKPNRYHIRVDDGPDITTGNNLSPDHLHGNGHANVSASKLTKLDEPSIRVCPDCQFVEGKDSDSQKCHGNGGLIDNFQEMFGISSAPKPCSFLTPMGEQG